VQGRRRGSCGTEDGGELRTQRRTPASCGWEGRRRAADMGAADALPVHASTSGELLRVQARGISS
jgi:hypothetical protein